MKEKYKRASLEIIKINTDIITTSGNPVNIDTDNYDPYEGNGY